MAKEIDIRCPVCKGFSPFAVAGRPAEPCSRACRKALRLTIGKKAKAEAGKKKNTNAKTTTKKSSSSDA